MNRLPASRHAWPRMLGRAAAVLVLTAALTVGLAAAAGAGPTPAPAPPGAAPTPSPSPATGPPTATASPSPSAPGDDEPGLFDIPGQIRKAINDTVRWVARTGLKPVLDTLGRTVLSTPDLPNDERVRQVWTTSLAAADAILVLFVVAAGFVVAARENLQTQYGLKEVLPRLAVGALAANLSPIICGKAIEATNALTRAIAGQGVDGASASAAIAQALDNATVGNNFLLSMLIIAALVMAVMVMLSFILRVALLVVLIGAAPLALLCHGLPQTEGVAHTWWRAFGACLGIQLGQALVVVAAVKVFLTPAGPTVLGLPSSNDGLLGVLICLTMLWLLVKIPSWMHYFVLGQLGRRHGRGLAGQIIHAVVLVKTVGALGRVARGNRTRMATGARRGHTAASRTPPPGSAARTWASHPRGGTPVRPARPGRAAGATPRRHAPGRAMFSNAPAAQRPPAAPVGTTGPVAFSHPPRPATPRPAPASQTSPPARFSDAPAAHRPRPAAPLRPAAEPTFSDAPRTPTPGRGPLTPASPPAFSAAPRPHPAPERRGGPATPVFSSAPQPPSRATTPPRSRGTAPPPPRPGRKPPTA